MHIYQNIYNYNIIKNQSFLFLNMIYEQSLNIIQQLQNTKKWIWMKNMITQITQKKKCVSQSKTFTSKKLWFKHTFTKVRMYLCKITFLYKCKYTLSHFYLSWWNMWFFGRKLCFLCFSIIFLFEWKQGSKLRKSLNHIDKS